MCCIVTPTPFTLFGCKYPQIKAESLHLKHIMSVLLQVHFGGVQRQKDENCVNVPIYGLNFISVALLWLLFWFFYFFYFMYSTCFLLISIAAFSSSGQAINQSERVQMWRKVWEEKKGGSGHGKAGWLMFCGWGKMVVLDRTGSDNHRCWMGLGCLISRHDTEEVKWWCHA